MELVPFNTRMGADLRDEIPQGNRQRTIEDNSTEMDVSNGLHCGAM